MTDRRRVLALLASAGIGSLAGCGSQDGGDTTTETKSAESDSTPTRTTTATTTPTTTLTPNSTPTPTDTPTSTETPTPTDIPSQTEGEKIAATDGDSDDAFGTSIGVAADGSTAVIGAPFDESGGSAYLFTRVGGDWQQQTKLAPNNGDSRGGRFGRSVGVPANGNTAIIGDPSDTDQNGQNTGSAYVFTRTGGGWQQQAKLIPNDNGDNFFGKAVEITPGGNTVVIGAPRDETPNQDSDGSAYVFIRTDEQWQQQTKLIPDDSGGAFGFSCDVAADGSTAVIGAPFDTNSKEGGSTHVFTRTDGEWQQQARFAPDDVSGEDRFGRSVGLSADGDTSVTGAVEYDSLDGADAGLAYVFTRTDGDWQQQARLAPDDSDRFDFFGFVGITADGNTTVIGAPGDEGAGDRAFAGSAHVFTQTDGEWQQQAELVASDGDSEDQFGAPVEIAGRGSTAVIGAGLDDDPNGEDAGSAYVFSLDTLE